MSPASGASGGGTPIKLEGTGFAADARVLFNGVDAVVVSAEATALEVRTPAGAVGPASVTVVNPQGRSFTLEGAFRYVTARVLTLQPGWNNVSWAGAPTPVTASINALAGRVDRVFAWDPERQVYDSFIVAAPSFLNTLSMLQRGQALWLFVTGEEPVRWEQPLVFDDFLDDRVGVFGLFGRRLPASMSQFVARELRFGGRAGAVGALKRGGPARGDEYAPRRATRMHHHPLQAEAVGVGVEPAAASAVAGHAGVEGGTRTVRSDRGRAGARVRARRWRRGRGAAP